MKWTAHSTHRRTWLVDTAKGQVQVTQMTTQFMVMTRHKNGHWLPIGFCKKAQQVAAVVDGWDGCSTKVSF